MNTYTIGQATRLSAAFTETPGGSPADPTTVTLYVRTPDRALSTHVYGVDGNVIKDSTGIYHYDFTPAEPGTHAYRWEGVGAVTDAAEVQFFVPQSKVL